MLFILVPFVTRDAAGMFCSVAIEALHLWTIPTFVFPLIQFDLIKGCLYCKKLFVTRSMPLKDLDRAKEISVQMFKTSPT